MPVFRSCDSCAPLLGVGEHIQPLAGYGQGKLECEKLTPGRIAFYSGMRDELFVSEIVAP